MAKRSVAMLVGWPTSLEVGDEASDLTPRAGTGFGFRAYGLALVRLGFGFRAYGPALALDASRKGEPLGRRI